MDFLNGYLSVVVLGICVCVGYSIKHAFHSEKLNRFIPLIMGIIGIAVNVWVIKAISPEIVLGGLVNGLASTGMYEMVKNFIECRKIKCDDDENKKDT